jgi:hypothetical protein
MNINICIDKSLYFIYHYIEYFYKGVCSGMIREMIYKYLQRKRDKEQYEVIKLRWKKAELERLLEQRKNEVKLYEEH